MSLQLRVCGAGGGEGWQGGRVKPHRGTQGGKGGQETETEIFHH